MAYRLTYTFNIDWIPGGIGVLGGAASTSGVDCAGPAQTIGFSQTNPGQNSLTFVAADITALTNAMAADAVAQLTAQIARIQAFATGGN